MERYLLPAQLGGGEVDGYPMDAPGDDGSWIVVQLVGHEVAMPAGLLTEVKPADGARFDLAAETPARIPDYKADRVLSIEAGNNGFLIKFQVVDGEQYGRAALLDLDGSERAAWTVLKLVADLRAGA